MLRKALLAGLFLALIVTVSAEPLNGQDKTKEGPQMLEGKDAPDFTPLFALNGKKARLEDLKGKVVLVDFWAVWCGPCIATFPKLRKWHEDYNEKGLEIVGLTRLYQRYDFKDGKLAKADENLTQEKEQEMLERFAKHHKLPYRIQAVEAGDFAKYKIRGIPTAVLIDRQGKVAMVKVGSGPANAKALDEKIKELIAQTK